MYYAWFEINHIINQELMYFYFKTLYVGSLYK